MEQDERVVVSPPTVPATARRPPAGLTVTHDVEQAVSWLCSGVERLVYHYATDRHKAYIHPLRSQSGEVLTYLEPWDHVWHRGLWFSWKLINGINFWEETVDGVDDGRTEYAGTDAVIERPDGTTVITRYTYRAPGGAILLQERRAVRISLPADGSCVIDWEAAFTAADQPVRLDCTPANIDPTSPWGGYAGLAYRAAPTWSDVHGLDGAGRRDRAIHHQRAPWAALCGSTQGGERLGLAILDHPGNPRSPTYWYYWDEPGFAYLNPSLLVAEPYDLAPGAVLHLRYRVLVLEGSPDASALAAHHAAFALTPGHL